MTSSSIHEVCRIAILITCYNRCETTLKCLNAIKEQTGLCEIKLQVYLVDDGCMDGTGEVVRRTYPEVKVLQGDGSLYWCGGTRMAWEEALKGDYDYYFWLNDDTHLYKNSIRRLVDNSILLSQSGEGAVILVGATCAPSTDVCTYSGIKFHGFVARPAFSKIAPSAHNQRCDTFNGNCVLISREITEKIGILCADYTHGIGDFDYGLRAKRSGIQNWLADGFVGECESKSEKGSWRDEELSIEKRLKAMKAPTGLPPAREWMIFTWRHAGWAWPLCWIRTIVRVLFPRLKVRKSSHT